MAEDFITIAKTADVPRGGVRTFAVRGRYVAVCNVDGEFFAVDDVCTHDDGPLGSGFLEGYAIECPRHGARFDVRSGVVLQMPAAYGIRTYPTRITGEDVQVQLGEDHE